MSQLLPAEINPVTGFRNLLFTFNNTVWILTVPSILQKVQFGLKQEAINYALEVDSFIERQILQQVVQNYVKSLIWNQTAT